MCALSSNNAPAYAIFGDSHAGHIYPGITELDKNNTWLLIGNYGCPPIVGIKVTQPLPLIQDCQQRSQKALEYLLNTPSIHTIVFSFFGNSISNITFAADHKKTHFELASIQLSRPGYGTSADDKVGLFYLGLENAINLLEQKNKSIIINDVSELPFSPRDCIRQPAFFGPDKTCKLQKSVALEGQKDLREILSKLATAHPKIRLYDPFNLLCDKELCNFENDDILFYGDSHHLSVRGSAFLAKDFLRWMSKN